MSRAPSEVAVAEDPAPSVAPTVQHGVAEHPSPAPNPEGDKRYPESMATAELPGGGPFTERGTGRWSIVPGTADLRVSLTSQMTTRNLCGFAIPYDGSCWRGDLQRVIINTARWERGAVVFQGNIVAYQQYLINHEVGHALNFDHVPCPANGELAPVMMQQTWGTSNNYLTDIGTDRVTADDKKISFITPSGTYVAQEKYKVEQMSSASYGLPSDAALGYDSRIPLAVRLSNSGIFVHAAPWSVADQGVRNVSHGCVKLSPEAGRWFYDNFGYGDIVTVSNTSTRLEPTDGFGDWNIPWDEWLEGSALR